MKVDIDGLELYYDTAGEGGPPLLLLHGNGEDGTVFAPLASKLSRHYTVYVPDSRNHGKSAKSDDVSYEAMASDLKGLIRELDLVKPLVVGFSDGAIIAMMAELSAPGLFRKMALLGANLSPADFVPCVYDELREAYGKNPDPLLNLMLTEPHIDPFSLRAIEAPALVVAADKDMFRTETFTAITDALPRARLMFVYGHDHGSYVLGNDMLYRPLYDFFRMEN